MNHLYSSVYSMPYLVSCSSPRSWGSDGAGGTRCSWEVRQICGCVGNIWDSRPEMNEMLNIQEEEFG